MYLVFDDYWIDLCVIIVQCIEVVGFGDICVDVDVYYVEIGVEWIGYVGWIVVVDCFQIWFYVGWWCVIGGLGDFFYRFMCLWIVFYLEVVNVLFEIVFGDFQYMGCDYLCFVVDFLCGQSDGCIGDWCRV